MADRRFFARKGPFTLAELCDIASCELDGESGQQVEDVAPLREAADEHISFFDNRKYRHAFEESQAGACIVKPQDVELAPDSMSLLITPAPYVAYAIIASTFYPDAIRPVCLRSSGVEATASIADSAFVHDMATVGPHVSIGARSEIGPYAMIGPGVEIGDDVIIGAGCTITHSLIGHRVIIHPGASIGQDGFGFAPTDEGMVKVPQLGRVIIEDDVEIGANTTVDRGSGPDTVLGRGTKIDNLVQIGHNVRIGESSVIVAQTGIAGSTRIGHGVVMGGQAGIAGHLSIGDGAQIAAQSGVAQDVAPGMSVGGTPSVPIRQWHRQNSSLSRLAKQRGNMRPRHERSSYDDDAI